MSGYTGGFTRHSTNDVDVQAVSIISVDLGNNIASGMTKNRTALPIDISHHVGAIHVTPAIGEQWYIEKHRGVYRLKSQIPYNNVATTVTPTQGQTQVGSGSGPVQLHGSQINANGPLRLSSGNSPLPDAGTVDSGSMMFDKDRMVPTFSDGTNWNPLMTSADVTAQVSGKYTLPDSGIPPTDMSSSVQSALNLANTAIQNKPGVVNRNMLSSEVNDSLALANTALQSFSLAGSPYDLSIVGFGLGTRRVASSYGDNPFGVKLQRACTLTSVTFRCYTADASGNLVCELRKNAVQISGTSTTIAAASQVSGGTSAFSQACSAGDIITVYITAVGTTPGLGLVADVTGVMA